MDATEELTTAQQDALQQYMSVTDQDAAAAIPLLRRSEWNVQIAITRFFDGDTAEPVDLHAADLAPRAQQAAFENLQESFLRAGQPRRAQHNPYQQRQRAPEADRVQPARRIVPRPTPPIWRPPYLVALLLTPVSLGFRALLGLWGSVLYICRYILPTAQRPRGLFGIAPVGTARRQLSPRDAATRFRREFEETYGTAVAAAAAEAQGVTMATQSSVATGTAAADAAAAAATASAVRTVPFVEQGYAQAFDEAKTTPKFLLLVLLSPEHDDTDRFVRETLLAPAVLDLLHAEKDNMVVWGGNVRDTEAYQVGLEFQATQFPFSALICVTPKDGSSSGNATRMSTIKRLAGCLAASAYATQLRDAMAKYRDDLAAVRAERVANEVSRNLRAEQDNAYERSLAIDRERARQRQAAAAAAAAEAEAAERRAREQAAEAARKVRLARQWRAWRTSTLAPEPAPGTSSPDMVRVALKLPESHGGQRIRRAFASGATVDDLYAFVECQAMKGGNNHNGNEEEDEEEDEDEIEIETDATGSPLKPANYTHPYKFRIASVMPREVHEPSEEKILFDAIGKSASLVVEEIDDDEDDEEDESEEDV